MAEQANNELPNINILARSLKSMRIDDLQKKDLSFELPPCKCFTFSPDGLYIAICDFKSVRVVSSTNPLGDSLFKVDKAKIAELKFSPLSTYLALWQPAARDAETQQLPNNLFIYNWAKNLLVLGYLHKKQSDWVPQWSKDEFLMCRHHNADVLCYEDHQFSAYKNKLHQKKLSNYKLSPASKNPYSICIYVPGSKGEPSFVKMFQYPNFSTPLASKSFFKADSCQMTWNSAGTAVLILTASETTANSYYGEQHLHFISTKQDACMVPRGKDGPVYNLDWNPNSKEFCVVYGYMPAKASLYNLKCDVTFDFGTGPRNSVFYNPFGNMLCLAGFGNVGGNLDLWDLEQKKSISKFECRDMTHVEWLPDGVHLLTATLSPRLRVNNCYKVWHYTGVQLKELKMDELYNVTWQPVSKGSFEQPSLKLTSQQEAMIKKNAATAAEKNKAYVPPALRKRIEEEGEAAVKKAAASKLSQAYELPSNLKDLDNKPVNKNALKNKKKRDNKKAKKLEEAKKQQT